MMTAVPGVMKSFVLDSWVPGLLPAFTKPKGPNLLTEKQCQFSDHLWFSIVLYPQISPVHVCVCDVWWAHLTCKLLGQKYCPDHLPAAGPGLLTQLHSSNYFFCYPSLGHSLLDFWRLLPKTLRPSPVSAQFRPPEMLYCKLVRTQLLFLSVGSSVHVSQ